MGNFTFRHSRRNLRRRSLDRRLFSPCMRSVRHQTARKSGVSGNSLSTVEVLEEVLRHFPFTCSLLRERATLRFLEEIAT